MKTVSVWSLIFLAVSLHHQGAVAPLPVQVVPQGIESVNGSDVKMGCTSPLVDIGNVMFCSSNCSISYLLDGNSPVIDTRASDWASQLVTVRKNNRYGYPVDHVVLTFVFGTAVTLTSIELDVFLCIEWNIGAPYISVYAEHNSSLILSSPFAEAQSSVFLTNHRLQLNSSCDSLSTVRIPLKEKVGNSSYLTWHILITFILQRDIEWVHVGEVRFLGNSMGPHSFPSECKTGSSANVDTPQITPCYIELQSTSVPGGMENDHTRNESSISAVIAVSAVSLLLIVTLTTVILTQCLLMIRMRKSKDVLHRNETYAEVMTSTTKHMDVPVTPNEAYALHKMHGSKEDVTYEFVA